MWKASGTSIQKGLKVGSPNSRCALSPLTSCVTSGKSLNLVSLSFCFHKMGVRSLQLPQHADHRSPGGGSCIQVTQIVHVYAVVGSGQGSSCLGLTLPVRWQRLTGWPLGKGGEAVGAVYARPCTRLFQCFIPLPPLPACRRSLSPPFRVRDLRLRRIESFTQVAYSTEPGLPDSTTKSAVWKRCWFSRLCSPWCLLVSKTTCSAAEAPSPWPSGANAGSSDWHLEPLCQAYP